MNTTTPHRRTPLTAAAVLASGALLLTGCAAEVRSASSEPSTSAPVATTASAEPVAETTSAPAKGMDVDELVQAWEAATGLECLREEGDDPVSAPYVARLMMCDATTVMITYTEDIDEEPFHEGIASDMTGDDGMDTFLYADYWSVLTEQDVAEDMQVELGGNLQSIYDFDGGPQKPAAAAEISSIEDLISAWEQVTGLTCQGEPSAGGEFRSMGAACTDNDALSVFDDPTDLQDQLEVVQSLLQGLDAKFYRLVGETWMADSNLDTLTKLQEVIGGEIVPMN